MNAHFEETETMQSMERLKEKIIKSLNFENIDVFIHNDKYGNKTDEPQRLDDIIEKLIEIENYELCDYLIKKYRQNKKGQRNRIYRYNRN